MSWSAIKSIFRRRDRAEKIAAKVAATLPPDHWDALKVERTPSRGFDEGFFRGVQVKPSRGFDAEFFKELNGEPRAESPEDFYAELERKERERIERERIVEEVRRALEDERRRRELEEEGRRIDERIRREEEARAAREADEIPAGTLEDARNFARARQGTPRDSADEWIATGFYRLIQGDGNVYAAKYDLQEGKLYVQYKHWDPSMELGTQDGPGPVYEYSDVTPAEARAFYNAPDAGVWLWDNVRVRGSWALHRKPYKIVAISRGYLPRKAVHNYRGSGEEWFVPRSAWGPNGRAVASQLPLAPAPPLSYDGVPLRGTPNRGRPNNGRPK